MKARKWTALFLSLLMLLSSLPLTALAATAQPTDKFCPVSNDNKHTWGNWMTDRLATCSEKGQRSRTCRYCRYTQTESIKKEEHQYGDWTVTKKATCSAEGTRQRKCKVCGHKDQESIGKLEHTWGGWTVAKEATCTQSGSRSHVCKVCGQKETQKVKKLPHAWGEWTVLTEATDHSSGVRTHACTLCGVEETEQYDPEGTLRLKDKGDGVKQLNSELICYGVLKGKPGNTFNKNTEKAVKKVQQAEGLEADGVAWPQTRARLGHQFGEWQIVSEMTDFSAGLRQRTCARCKYTEKVEEFPSPMYQKGDKGDGVAALQKALTAAGFKPGTADGVFGNKTKKAVQAFQKKNKLKQDGIAWPGVLKMLGVQAAAEKPSPEDVSLGASTSVVLSNPAAGLPVNAPPSETAGSLSDFAAVERSLRVLELPKEDEAYYTGAVVPVKMRLTLDSFDDYSFLGVDCADGDSYQQEDWMFSPLSAGSHYDFTYFMALDPEKFGWKKRELTVRFRSISTKGEEQESAMVGPPFTYPTVTLEAPPRKTINDYAAYLYLDILRDKYTGAAYDGENMDIPYLVDSDGNTSIRDVKLVCEQQMLGKTYDTQTVPVTVSMSAGDQLSRVARVRIKKTDGAVAGGYSLNLYLTGIYYNQKGDKETVTSLPVPLSFSILEQSWNAAQLNLTVTADPEKTAYSPNDSVKLTYRITSDGTEGVRDVLVGPAGANASEFGGPTAPEGGELMKPGDEATADFIYWIKPEDLKKDTVEIDFAASGTAETSGLPVRSPRVTVTLPVTSEPPEEKILLSAAPLSPKEYYQTGVAVPCRITAAPDVTQPIKWIRIYATGDNRRTGYIGSSAWHDFGHGVKGFVCYLQNSPPYKQSFGATLDVSIPATARDKGGYCAGWTAEAELKDGTLIRSNTAYLPLPIDPEKAVLEVSYTKGAYAPGTVLTPMATLTYTGGHKASHFKLLRRLRYKDKFWQEAGDLYLDDSGTGKQKIFLPLNKEDAIKGKWEYMIMAAAKDRDGTLNTNIISLEIPVGEAAPAVADITAKAWILSKPSSPETGWQLGDKVLIRAEGVYTGGSVDRMSLTRELAGQVYTDSAHECDNISEEYEVTLTEDVVTDGEFFCSYTFEAYRETDGVEELIRASRPANIWLRLNDPSYVPVSPDGEGAEEEGSEEAGEAGTPAEDGSPAADPEAGPPAAEAGSTDPEAGTPAGEEPGEPSESEFFPEGEGAGGEEKAPEKHSINPASLPAPGTESAPSPRSAGSKPGETEPSTEAAGGKTAGTASSTDSATGETAPSPESAPASDLPADLPDGDELEALLSADGKVTYSGFEAPKELLNSVLNVPVGAEEDFCFGAWAGLLENLPQIEVTFCKKHAELPGAGTVPLTDPQEAETLWLEALNAEYDALKASAELAKDTEKAAALEEARTLFLADLETLRAESTQEMVLFRLMLQTAAVCEISHTSEDPLASLQELALPGADDSAPGEDQP